MDWNLTYTEKRIGSLIIWQWCRKTRYIEKKYPYDGFVVSNIHYCWLSHVWNTTTYYGYYFDYLLLKKSCITLRIYNTYYSSTSYKHATYFLLHVYSSSMFFYTPRLLIDQTLRNNTTSLTTCTYAIHIHINDTRI